MAKSDPSKKNFLQKILLNLKENTSLRESSLLTLCLVTFGKRKISELQKLPSIEDVVQRIKECTLTSADQQKKLSPQEVHDFDVDLFFVCCELIPQYTKDTKTVFLDLMSKFVTYMYKQFMVVFHLQREADGGKNPFDDNLKEFLLRVTELCMTNEGEQIEVLSLKIIVDICLNQLRENIEDRDGELDKSDFWGIQLFRKVVTFFNCDLGKQLELIREITVQMLWWVSDQLDFTEQQHSKLNLKLIHFLQFIEEIYCHSFEELMKAEHCQNWQELLQLIMYLFEQTGLLTLDMPDQRPFDEPVRIQEPKKQQTTKEKQDLLLSLDDPLQLEMHKSVSRQPSE